MHLRYLIANAVEKMPMFLLGSQKHEQTECVTGKN